jgi:hypothetical protein
MNLSLGTEGVIMPKILRNCSRDLHIKSRMLKEAAGVK